jgi:hypothetical protein
VIEVVGVLDERISAMRNSKLYLAYNMPILYIDEDIVRSSLQPIHDSHQRKRTTLLAALEDLLIELQHLLLS